MSAYFNAPYRIIFTICHTTVNGIVYDNIRWWRLTIRWDSQLPCCFMNIIMAKRVWLSSLRCRANTRVFVYAHPASCVKRRQDAIVIKYVLIPAAEAGRPRAWSSGMLMLLSKSTCLIRALLYMHVRTRTSTRAVWMALKRQHAMHGYTYGDLPDVIFHTKSFRSPTRSFLTPVYEA